ncbi:DUF2971 domain-containing protein [Robbsia andropogonis]|uniref:DUF2971 domain-containing protein n=1 Tax=Robbsia andropogonis TaxID=28092 RepID=UPI0020A1E808|nr:DUF2971 domain-containing protein [Robbsia andropogonis]MCP1120688.1 DUF2971 domain-containing protein [Robbsia andropogonis]MCP1130423.1 DUF2971 domain-containing protein [Robbsia andropogonis]
MEKNLLYKYVSVSTLKRILGGTIRLTQPGAFNDPFELLPEIITRSDQAEEQISLSFDILAPRREAPLDAVINVTDGHVASDYTSRNILEQLNQQVGILCLSKSSNSNLMWSHYADQYQGAVIAFDADHEFFTGQVTVEYVDERPKKHIEAYKTAPIPLSELCAKSVEWQYEQEVRIIRALRDCNKAEITDVRGFPVFTLEVPQEAINFVSMGERTPVSHQKEIFQLIHKTRIGLTLSAVDNVGYGFRQEIILYPGEFRNPTVSPRTAHIFAGTNSAFSEMARWMIENHPASNLVNKTV